MPWWIWILAIVIGLWVSWKAICWFGKGVEPAPSPTLLKPKRESAAGLDDWEKEDLKLDRIMDRIGEGNYGRCYTALEKLALEVPRLADDILAGSLTECFEGMCEGKKPAAVLKQYDTLNQDRPGIGIIDDNGDTGQLASTLMFAISDDWPDKWTKAAIKKFIAFVEQDHPLIDALREHEESNLLDYLNQIGEQIFEDEWKEYTRLDEAIAYFKAYTAS